MKIFRRFRLKWAAGNGFRKYLLYAIGEIVLVVIGILIAVSLNNANEERKATLEVKQIANKVQKKIEKDIGSIQELREILFEDLKLYNLYLSKKEKSDKERLYIVSQTPYLVTINVDFLDYSSVISSSLDKATILNDTLSKKLLEIDQLYTTASKSLSAMEALIGNELIANITHIKDNYDWYEKLVTAGTFTPEEFTYFESIDYRNRVVHMKFLYLESYGQMLETFELELKKRENDLTALLKSPS